MEPIDVAMKKIRTDTGRHAVEKCFDTMANVKRDVATALALLSGSTIGQERHERLLGAYQDASLLHSKLSRLHTEIDDILRVSGE